MGSYPVKVDKRPVSQVDEAAVEVTGRAVKASPFVSFQYSYQFLPILFAPKISINIPAQGQMRMEY